MGETHAALAPIVRHGREEEEVEEAPPLHGPAPPRGRGRALGEGTRGGGERRREKEKEEEKEGKRGGGRRGRRGRIRRRRRRRRREKAFAPPAPTLHSPERTGPRGGTSPTDSAWVARLATRRASSRNYPLSPSSRPCAAGWLGGASGPRAPRQAHALSCSRLRCRPAAMPVGGGSWGGRLCRTPPRRAARPGVGGGTFLLPFRASLLLLSGLSTCRAGCCAGEA